MNPPKSSWLSSYQLSTLHLKINSKQFQVSNQTISPNYVNYHQPLLKHPFFNNGKTHQIWRNPCWTPQVEREVLCAGLALRVNWKVRRAELPISLNNYIYISTYLYIHTSYILYIVYIYIYESGLRIPGPPPMAWSPKREDGTRDHTYIHIIYIYINMFFNASYL